jgi:hypothetical protein
VATLGKRHHPPAESHVNPIVTAKTVIAVLVTLPAPNPKHFTVELHLTTRLQNAVSLVLPVQTMNVTTERNVLNTHLVVTFIKVMMKITMNL